MPQVLSQHATRAKRRNHPAEATSHDYRPPRWLVVTVLFFVVWFGVQIVNNVTHSLSAITGLVTDTQAPPKR